MERYRVTEEELEQEPEGLLECIGRRRGHLRSGGIVDTERTAKVLMDEYRGGKLGRLTLEWPSSERKDTDAESADGSNPEV